MHLPIKQGLKRGGQRGVPRPAGPRNAPSNKTRIETWHGLIGVALLLSRNAPSNKTRIETVQPCSNVAAGPLAMHLPIKQGLKLPLPPGCGVDPGPRNAPSNKTRIETIGSLEPRTGEGPRNAPSNKTRIETNPSIPPSAPVRISQCTFQ